jgi:hypothetical protein
MKYFLLRAGSVVLNLPFSGKYFIKAIMISKTTKKADG